MDSKNESDIPDSESFHIGDIVMCIMEEDIPEYVGTIWKVSRIRRRDRTIYLCTDTDRSDIEFAFFEYEIVKVTSLLKELV